MTTSVPRALLVVLDGWGVADPHASNAIHLARKPAYDALLASSLHTVLEASGEDVGLPAGVMGNSEVGHLNIGCGRVVEQDLLRIGRAAGNGSLLENRVLVDLLDRVRKRGRALHLMGLVSDGAVHAMDAHLVTLVEAAARRGLAQVHIHAFLDGRDTPPRSAGVHLERVERQLRAIGVGRLATVCGRYYAMDRDNRWERTELAWRAIVDGEGLRAPSWAAAIEQGYAAGTGDEFVLPTLLGEPEASGSRVVDGDGILFINFRADRARQLTRALTEKEFDGFARTRWPAVDMVTMTVYDAGFSVPALFSPVPRTDILADVLAAAGIGNLRVAETEKYAHVTYFFNGGREQPWPGEARRLIPSPKVATYDLRPEMSAVAVTDAIVEAIESPGAHTIISNYANADMVGHTGNLGATVRAVETLDACLARLVRAADAHGLALLLTADHGNAELMVDPKTGAPHTAHTTNPVPFVVRAPGLARRLARGGRLADVVPTLLDYWGLAAPASMTGESLLRP